MTIILPWTMTYRLPGPNRSSLRGGGISAPSSKRKSFINGQMPPISSLAFSFSEQVKAEKYFAKIKRVVFKRWMEKDHKCSIMIIPNAHRGDALSLFAFRETDPQERYKRMENIAAQAFEKPHVQRCLVLAVDIDEQHYPYSTLAVFVR